MKKPLLGFLLVLISLQAMAVGHPHNLFAARKQLKAKDMLATPTTKTTGKPVWTLIHQVKTGAEISCRLVALVYKATGK